MEIIASPELTAGLVAALGAGPIDLCITQAGPQDARITFGRGTTSTAAVGLFDGLGEHTFFAGATARWGLGVDLFDGHALALGALAAPRPAAAALTLQVGELTDGSFTLWWMASAFGGGTVKLTAQ
jgi:hypothetical protein